MAAWWPAARIAMAASALAVLPFVVYNVGVILSAEGSIVHMTPGEWLIITAILSLALWLGSATILAASAIATRHNLWLSTPLALLAFTGITLWMLDGDWTDLFNPAVYGWPWLLVTGVLATACVLILKWMATPEVTLG